MISKLRNFLSLVLLVCLVPIGIANAQTANGRIVFQAVTEKSGGLSLMDGAGNHQMVLVNGGSAPTWSRDGCKIVYSGGRDGATIFTVFAETPVPAPKLIAVDASTPVDGMEMRPYFSPDGSRVVFVSGSNEIVVANADGSGLYKLRKGERASDPTWSPDGLAIRFFPSGSGGIRIVNIDGTQSRDIPLRGTQAQWSPDGSQIVFVAESGIGVMHVADSTIQMLANTDHSFLPSWSPDGSKIAFQSVRDDDVYIDVMDSDGEHRRKLADHVFFEMSGGIPPTWSPDGSRVAFTRMPLSTKELIAKGPDAYANVKFDVYAVNVDGTHLTALTKTGRALHPVWSPTSNCRASH